MSNAGKICRDCYYGCSDICYGCFNPNSPHYLYGRMGGEMSACELFTTEKVEVKPREPKFKVGEKVVVGIGPSINKVVEITKVEPTGFGYYGLKIAGYFTSNNGYYAENELSYPSQE